MFDRSRHVTASMPVTTALVCEAPNVAPDSAHMSVPVRLIRPGIRVVVKITGTVSGSIRSIPTPPVIPKGVTLESRLVPDPMRTSAASAG